MNCLVILMPRRRNSWRSQFMSVTHSIHALAQFIVESSFETNDRLDVRHKSKRYILVPKTVVVSAKSLTFYILSNFNLPKNLFTLDIWLAHLGIVITAINPTCKSVCNSKGETVFVFLDFRI